MFYAGSYKILRRLERLPKATGKLEARSAALHCIILQGYLNCNNIISYVAMAFFYWKDLARARPHLRDQYVTAA